MAKYGIARQALSVVAAAAVSTFSAGIGHAQAPKMAEKDIMRYVPSPYDNSTPICAPRRKELWEKPQVAQNVYHTLQRRIEVSPTMENVMRLAGVMYEVANCTQNKTQKRLGFNEVKKMYEIVIKNIPLNVCSSDVSGALFTNLPFDRRMLSIAYWRNAEIGRGELSGTPLDKKVNLYMIIGVYYKLASECFPGLSREAGDRMDALMKALEKDSKKLDKLERGLERKIDDSKKVKT